MADMTEKLRGYEAAVDAVLAREATDKLVMKVMARLRDQERGYDIDESLPRAVSAIGADDGGPVPADDPEWVCDRCGRTSRCLTLPRSWRRFWEQTRGRHLNLCHPCAFSFGNWFNEHRVLNRAGEAELRERAPGLFEGAVASTAPVTRSEALRWAAGDGGPVLSDAMEARARALALLSTMQRDLRLAGMYRDCVHSRDGASCANCGQSIVRHRRSEPGVFECVGGSGVPGKARSWLDRLLGRYPRG